LDMPEASQEDIGVSAIQAVERFSDGCLRRAERIPLLRVRQKIGKRVRQFGYKYDETMLAGSLSGARCGEIVSPTEGFSEQLYRGRRLRIVGSGSD